jgi:hypothetical protein
MVLALLWIGTVPYRFEFDADPVPTFHFDTYPDPDPTPKVYTCWDRTFSWSFLHSSA